MNEHFFQKKSKQTIGLIGYILGVSIFVGAIVGLFVDSSKSNFVSHVMIGCMGLIVAFLADIILSSNARTDLLLRIMKRQETLFRQSQKNKSPNIPPDPLGILKNIMGNKSEDNTNVTGLKISLNEDGEMKFAGGDEPPEELFNILKKVTGALKEAIEKDVGKSMEEMSTEELQAELDKCIKKENYQRAGVIRDEINKRESGNNNESD